MTDLLYSVRGSFGFSLRRGVKDGGTEVTGLALDPKVNLVKCLKFSDDGIYMAYCDSLRTAVMEVNSGKELFSADLPKTCEIFFSPRSTYMVTYQLYVIWGTRKNEDGTDRVPDPNLRIWSLPDGKLLATIIAEEQFTDDERLMFRLQGSELLVYDAPNFERYVRKVVVKDLVQFLLSPGADPFLACFIPSLKGHPALIQLRQSSGELPVIQAPTTFHGTSRTMSWNNKGSAVLVCATEEVDKSNESYYGSSMMYCIPVHGDAFMLDLDKSGPIYSYEWSPDSMHICVCYGYMPSKVTVFSIKGGVTWALGEGHQNEVRYNPFGNILAVCAFGNISSGKVQFWNVAKREEISSWNINCTTQFAWAPDGRHFYAATTHPVRLANCIRIFDYKHNLLHTQRYDDGQLWEVSWCPAPRDAFQEFEVEHLEDWQMEESERSVYHSKANPLKNFALGELTKHGSGEPRSPGRYVPRAIRGRKRIPSTTQQKMESSGEDTAKDLGPVAAKTKVVESLRKKLSDIKELKEQRDRGDKLKIHQQWKIAMEGACADELRRMTTAAKKGSSAGGGSNA